ncbi:glycine zipper domain-containing protein [Saccharicrinis aurantiacus]|uniref:glycine zipper domain-containing protein n=1 Tax=Saccharicrinis aurantiacus TaxID=1849719 RepID=UPI0009F89013|nr:glycine zipper domain-containing protein [Saccharicrinis aurantiacus]
MKYNIRTIFIALTFVLFAITELSAQQDTSAAPVAASTPGQPAAQPAPVATTTSIAKGLGLFVFPGEGQTQEMQDADEMSSYKWAMEQTGYDPINPPQIHAKEADTSLDGSAVVGGAKGAAAGAAIGAIAGDAGKGAAIGAVAGGLAGRRARKYGDHVEKQHNEQEVAAQKTKMLDDFKMAFSASMEAKGYTVK